MRAVLRLVVNFLLTGLLMMLFQGIGWVKIGPDITLFPSPLLNQLILSGVVGFIFLLGILGLDLLVALLVLSSCGLGCWLQVVKLIFLGPVGLYVVIHVLPGWMIVTASSWQMIVMGLAISLVRWHAETKTTRTVRLRIS